MKKAASINLDQHQSSSPRISKAITAEPVIKPANLAECETFEGKRNFFDGLGFFSG